jgi:hypothetical protein
MLNRVPVSFGEGSLREPTLKILFLLSTYGSHQLRLTADCFQLFERNNCGVVSLKTFRVEAAFAHLSPSENSLRVQRTLRVDTVVILLINFDLANLLHRLCTHVNHRLQKKESKERWVAISKGAYHSGTDF